MRQGAIPCVVTGQQAGLFGGPLFTLGKLLGAIKLARARGERAVFWVECDDADVAEVDQAWLVAADGELRRVATEAPRDGRPVGGRVLDEACRRALDSLEILLVPGPRALEAMADLRETWKPGALWQDAFIAYLARLTRGMEVSFLDPTQGELKEGMVPLFRRVLQNADGVEAALAAGAALGPRAQVPFIDGELPMFYLDDEGVRRKLERRKDGFGLKGTELVLSRKEAMAAVERTPMRFSAAVLLRPVAQDFILPTTLYVAGPAEAAYHRQAAPLYELLEVERPRVVARPRLTVIEPRTRRLLEKLDVPIELALAGEDAIVERLAVARSGIDPKLENEVAAGAVNEVLARLRERLEPLDPGTLGPAFEEAASKIGHQMGKLGGRAVEAMRRKSGDARRQAGRLLNLLMPRGEPQERVLCPLHFLSRHSREEVVGAAYDAIDPADPGKQIQLDLGVGQPGGASGAGPA